MAATGTDRGDAEGKGGRKVAGTAGAAAAAGAAVTGAQALLGMDAAAAATEGGTDSVVPLADAPAPVADADVDADVDAFLAEDGVEGSGTQAAAADDPGDDPLAALMADADDDVDADVLAALGADAGDDDLGDEEFEEPSLDL